MDHSLLTIPLEDLIELENGGGTKFNFCIDMSMLEHAHNWPDFPKQFNLPNGVYGCEEPMSSTDVQRDTDGTIQSAKYTQPSGLIEITIFND